MRTLFYLSLLESDLNCAAELVIAESPASFLTKFSWQDSEKQELFSSSPYFRVEVSILCGRELIAMDRGGTSDPYVLIKQHNSDTPLYRSQEKKKTVNPVWNDQANVCVENPFTPLVYEVRQDLLHLHINIHDCVAGL